MLVFNRSPAEELLEQIRAVNPENHFRLTNASILTTDAMPSDVGGFNSSIKLNGVALGGLDGSTDLNYNRLSLGVLTNAPADKIVITVNKLNTTVMSIEELLPIINKALGIKLTAGRPDSDLERRDYVVPNVGTSKVIAIGPGPLGSHRLQPGDIEITLKNNGLIFSDAVTKDPAAFVVGSTLIGDEGPNEVLDGKVDATTILEKIDFREFFAGTEINNTLVNVRADGRLDASNYRYYFSPEALEAINAILEREECPLFSTTSSFGYSRPGTPFLESGQWGRAMSMPVVAGFYRRLCVNLNYYGMKPFTYDTAKWKLRYAYSLHFTE